MKELQVNEGIREKKVRVIDAEGEQRGVISTKEGIQIARDSGLDLVKVAPNANPPVCKVLDYGKYKYEMAKREKEAKKKQKTITVKEIRLTPHIEEHDLKVKARQANDFLDKGDKVKVSVRFRGREMGHKEVGKQVLKDFIELTKEHGDVDRKPRLEGRNMIMFLVEKKD